MPRLPAFCESCGAVFASPLEAAAPGKENAFGIPVPCPACDGSGRVPGELLELSVEAARRFEEAGPGEGEAFLEVLSRLAEGGGGTGERELVVQTARRAPAFVETARRLPGGRPRVLAGIARLLRRIREGVGAEAPSASASDTGPDSGARRGDEDRRREAAVLDAVDGLLEEEAVEPEPADVPEEIVRARVRLESAGRNDACPCGSGDKYKNCHWIADLRTTRD